LTDAHEEVQARTAEVAEARSRAEIAEEGLAEANVRVDELGRELAVTQAARVEERADAEAVAGELAATRDSLSVVQGECARLEQERDDAVAAGEGAAEGLAALGEGADEIDRRVVAIDTALTSAGEHSAALERVAAEQEEGIAVQRQQLQELSEEVKASAARADGLARELTDAHEEVQARTAEVAEARSRAEIAEEGLAEANVRVDELGRERDEAMAFAGQAREIVGSLQERASEFGERTAALAAVLAPGDQSTGELDHSGPETYDDAAS
jgi:chromosome segregation ATPase